MPEYRSNIASGHFIEGVSRTDVRRSGATQERGGLAHMHRETVQVQHVAANAMDAKEWCKVAERLKSDDRTQLCWGRLLSRKKLRQASYSQTAGQHINS